MHTFIHSHVYSTMNEASTEKYTKLRANQVHNHPTVIISHSKLIESCSLAAGAAFVLPHIDLPSLRGAALDH